MSGDSETIHCSLKNPPAKESSKSPRPPLMEKEQPKLRSACDACHTAKIRCGGENPCARCARDVKARIGKPKGSLNKKTIERLQQMRQLKVQKPAPEPTMIELSSPETESTTRSTGKKGSVVAGGDEDSTAETSDSPQNSEYIHDVDNTPSVTFTFSPPQGMLFPTTNELDRMEDWLPMVVDEPMVNGMISEPDFANLPMDATAQILDSGFNFNLAGEEGDNARNWASISPPSDKSTSLDAISRLTPSSAKSNMSPAVSLEHNMPMTCIAPPSSSLDLRYATSTAPCDCFATISKHLCALQATSAAPKQARDIDALLIQAQLVTPSIRTLFECHQCVGDTQGLLLANMVLCRLLKWTHNSILLHGSRFIPAQVRLGKYVGSKELGTAVTKLLVRTHWKALKGIVDGFQQRVAQLACDDADGRYLIMQAKNFQRELEMLADKCLRPE
ncbi:C6 finger domain transcription factor [Paramyrothecium foliicola]|nr:C6 finger domain transcription factor [Paramyrothecium foliicola]